MMADLEATTTEEVELKGDWEETTEEEMATADLKLNIEYDMEPTVVVEETTD